MSFPMEDYGILADGAFELPELAHPRSMREIAKLKAAGEPDIKLPEHRLVPVKLGKLTEARDVF
nr:hypothetical protein B0A51_11075 [Rachicladosporium sp. CCFEE 5018]